jgi:hypothetical protein
MFACLHSPVGRQVWFWLHAVRTVAAPHVKGDALTLCSWRPRWGPCACPFSLSQGGGTRPAPVWVVGGLPGRRVANAQKGAGVAVVEALVEIPHQQPRCVGWGGGGLVMPCVFPT